MGESHASIKVYRGICLPVDQCVSLQLETIPVGEEVTEHMLSSCPIGTCDVASSPMATSSLINNPIDDDDDSGKTTRTQCSPAVTAAQSACTLLINKLGGGSLTTTSLLSSKTYQSIVRSSAGGSGAGDGAATHTLCHHLRSQKGKQQQQPRSLSVGHLGCLIRALLNTTTIAKSHSLPLPTRRKGRVTLDALNGCPGRAAVDDMVNMVVRAEVEKKTDLSAPNRLAKSRSARSVSPVGTRGLSRSGSERGSFYPSTVRWWDHPSSGSINRKAIFTVDSSFDEESVSLPRPGDSNEGGSALVEGKHLLLPGRSDFEDELVREVAHFELAEFVIGELEALNAMTRASPDICSQDFPAGSADVSGVTRAAVFARPDRTRAPSGSNGWRSSHSSLGFLAFVDPQNPRTIPARYSTTQHPTKDEGPNPFADLFGLVQQGLFVNVDGPRRQSPSRSQSTTGTSSTQQLFSPMSPFTAGNEDVDLDEPDLAQSHAVTTLASDLLTSCLERVAQLPPNSEPRLFLKDLHQLLVVSCDADWAFSQSILENSASRDYNNGSVGQYPELIPNRSLIPSNSAVVLPLYNDSGGQKHDLVSIDPHQLWTNAVNRRRSLSVSAVDQLHVSSPRSTRSELISVTRSPMRRSNTSVHPAAQQPQLRQQSSVLAGSKPNFSLSSLQSGQDLTGTRGARNSINAICTPLPYDLLTHPPLPKSQRKLILLRQNNRCAGCGLFVETRYLKRMRFCEFFGHYFCCVCHTNTLMALPGNVLHKWDFRMLPVCNIARDRLNQLHRQPLLRLSDFNRRVLHGQSSLRNCSALRRQGNLILPFVQFCHDARNLLTALQALPPHWLSSPDLWSMADLCAVRDGQLDRELRRALQPVVDHLSACTRCRARGFVCEICHSGQILFPFGQANTVSCPICMACFHRACLRNPKPESCPRCQRRVRRHRLQQSEQQRLDSDVPDSSYQLLC